MSSGAIAEVIRAELEISQPTVSQHLKILRDNGFANVQVEGLRRLYSVNTAPLREVDQWMKRFRRNWTPHLDAPTTEIAHSKRERRRTTDEEASQ